MKLKIVITGGLGYLGTELCKLLSGYVREYDIIAVDSRFLPERVNQLRRWGIRYIQGSILDAKLMKDIMENAYRVYHLAGITDVAYTKTEANSEQDKLIKEVAIDGTRNILSAIHWTTELIFPSTHVVFEGLKETKLHILENEQICPVLSYASSKGINEQEIRERHKKHIIVRLGSVYGLGADSMRMGIMPNLFAKITATGGTIKLFSGGEQYKSLIHLNDVVRAMIYLADKNLLGQTFHLTHENVKVQQVAALCQKVNPTVNVVMTNDEVPNMGYTLSNQKLIDTGFVFHSSLLKGLTEMIRYWLPHLPRDYNEKVVKGSKNFVDDRGKISNYELPEPINLVGLIESKSGTIRANHYHPVQQQKCLLISGSYISVTKDLTKKDAAEESKLILPGDLAIIPPMVAHAMIFTRDSVFLNLVNGERKHDNYGVTHTIPYPLVDDKKAAFYTQ